MGPEPLLGSNAQYSRYPLSYFAAQMRRLGLYQLDFVPQTPHFFCSHTGFEPPDAVLRTLEGLRVEVVTPPAYRYSITAPQGRQRAATLVYYTHCLALTKALGGWGMAVSAAGACWDIESERLEESAADMLKLLCAEAGRLGLTLLLAPSMGADAPLLAESPVLGTVRGLTRMLRRVGSARLMAALDTNVLAAAGETVPQWFRSLGERTGLVRLCDGNYHGYRAWGEGCLPMERYRRALAAAGYRGPLSLYLPGERYTSAPAHADEAMLRAISGGGAGK